MTVRSFARRMRPRVERKAAERVWQLRTMRRRRKAAVTDPELRPVAVKGQQLYGRVVDRFTAAEAAAENLDLVVGALEQAGISYFLVSSRTRYTIGVNAVDRERFITALEERHAGTAVFIGRPLPGGQLKHPALFLDGALPAALRTAPVLRIGENHLGPAGQLLAGPELACDVEFWEDGGQLLASADGPRRLAKVQPQASADIFAESLVTPPQQRDHGRAAGERAEARHRAGRRAGAAHLRPAHRADREPGDLPGRRRLHLGGRRGAGDAGQARPLPGPRHRRDPGQGDQRLPLHQPRRAGSTRCARSRCTPTSSGTSTS